MTLIGMVGVYVGKIYNEVKGRPLFIVESTTFESKRVKSHLSLADEHQRMRPTALRVGD